MKKTMETQTENFAENPTLVSEFIDYLRSNRKWWLTPLILALMLVGGLLLLAGKNAIIAPFIYTLF